MALNVRLGAPPLRAWIALLLARLSALPGLTVTVDVAPGPAGRSGPADLLLRFEALLARRPLAGWAAQWEGLAHRTAAPSPADLVLDLRGDAPEGCGAALWRLTFDGKPGETALLAALMAGHAPIVALTEGDRVVASARVGTEAHGELLTVFEDALARTLTLIEAALRGLHPLAEPLPRSPAPTLTFGAVAGHAAGRVLTKLGRGLDRLRYRQPHWRVGWRRLEGPDVVDLGRLPSTGWTDLPDDGTRFYADPFAIEHQGRTILFVEDYPYDRGKALISAVEFGPDGPLATPIPVLTEPHHLSYPFVFERDGVFWMIPESCAAGTVDLYRATRFPGEWVKERTLLSDVVASDVTLLEREVRWWMFATCRESLPGGTGLPARGSYSDALHLWSAPDFRGPWTPHPRNPVLIDTASARPAGRIVSRNGALIRPVQDCRRAYGGAMALARIDRLDDEAYAQSILARLEPGGGWAGPCLHTLNRSGMFEFIDGAGRVSRRASGGH